MPHTPFVDDDVLTADYINDNLMDQVVATVSSATRPAGTEGQVIYETDTDKVLIYSGSAWIEYGRLAGVSTWTPTIAQGASTNIAKTITQADYIRYGGVVEAWFLLALTAAGTAGSAVTVTLPVASSGMSSGTPVGAGEVNDATVQRYTSTLVYAPTDTIVFRISAGSNFGASPNIAMASGDALAGHIRYRVA